MQYHNNHPVVPFSGGVDGLLLWMEGWGMTHFAITPEYASWLKELKAKISSVQHKAALAANSVVIDFYYELGRNISEKNAAWGSKFLQKLSMDLKHAFPHMQGFSLTNLKYCRLFYEYVAIGPQAGDESEVPRSPHGVEEPGDATVTPFYQAIRQLPWGHIKMLIGKVKVPEQAHFYLHQTIENGWSRDVLVVQIQSNLYARQGKAISNFRQTLPPPQSDLAQQTLKDPYTFDFLTMTSPYNERTIETWHQV